MAIDWNLVALLTGPILGAVVWAIAARIIERRTKLVCYYGHVSSFSPPGQGTINAHSVVVRNAGKLPAHNVRLGHKVLPDLFSVFPPCAYEVQRFQEGNADICVPILAPGDQLTVSYLYAPPLLWNQTNTHVKCDEGIARVLNVLPTPQQPRWVIRIMLVVLFVGAVTIGYLLAKAVPHIIKLVELS
jgi:hypothetical protein